MIDSLRKLARGAGVRLLGGPLHRARLERIRRADPLVILSLHRVAPDDGSAFAPLAPSMFDRLLGFATRHFSLVTFAEIDRPSARPRMILSFDDGYRDFVDHAMPILARYGVRANQNVIPGCVESGLPPLPVLVADFLGRAPAELVGRLDIPGFDLSGRGPLWPRLDRYLSGLPQAVRRPLADHVVPQLLRWEAFRPAAMMNGEEVRQAAAVHEIGGHSFDHASMAVETDGFLRDDVRKCAAWIGRTTGAPMRIYTFPNGSFRTGQPEIVRAAGIEHVLLAGGGWGGTSGIHDRIGFVAASAGEMRFRALGARARVPAS